MTRAATTPRDDADACEQQADQRGRDDQHDLLGLNGTSAELERTPSAA